MRDPSRRRPAREDIAPEHGLRLVVLCKKTGCENGAIMTPGPLFGARWKWPPEGESNRFQCRCGYRRASVSYTRNASQADGPVTRTVAMLWL